jgi:8-oxo-dGTP pyrophosphatase MutT (NUDIX family)
MAIQPWPLLSGDTRRSFGIFNVRSDKARSPRTGRVHDFWVIEFPPWVNVIPLTPEGEVVMIRQYRHGIRSITLEIPGGVVEEGDSLQQAAIRELMEETGYRSNEWTLLGTTHPNPAIQNNECATFLANNVVLDGPPQPDDMEDIEVVRVPLAEVPRMLRTGAISHSIMVAAFCRFFLEYGLPGTAP